MKSFKNESTLQIEDIQETIAEMADINFLQLKTSPKEKHMLIMKELKLLIFGQDKALKIIDESLSSILLRITDKKRPLELFFFAGPTGTGKTFLAKTLAKLFFGNDDKFLQIDVSGTINSNEKAEKFCSSYL